MNDLIKRVNQHAEETRIETQGMIEALQWLTKQVHQQQAQVIADVEDTMNRLLSAVFVWGSLILLGAYLILR